MVLCTLSLFLEDITTFNPFFNKSKAVSLPIPL